MPAAPLTTHQQIVAGDDCKAADGRALQWSSATWPSLSGASYQLVVGHAQYNLYGNLPVTWTGPASSSISNGVTTVSFDVTGSESASLPAGAYDYMLTATLSNGDRVTLAYGQLTVLAAPGNVPLFPPAV